jgi:hypothetical protein
MQQLAVGTSWRASILESIKTPWNGSSNADAKPDLTMSSSQKFQMFVWFHLKSGWALNNKIIEGFLIFPAFIDPSSYDQRFESYDLKSGVWCWNSSSDRMRCLDIVGIWAHFQWKTDITLNTEIIEHFRNFLTRGSRTQNFDFEQESYDRLEVIELTRYNF